MTDSDSTSRRVEAIGRRRAALTALLAILGGTATLRALPASLPPPRPLPACAAPSSLRGAPDEPARLACDGQTPASGRHALLLGQPVDLNRASVADLAALPGIGERTAQRIVDDREAKGPFRTVDELDRVRGIGPRTVEKLRPLIAAR